MSAFEAPPVQFSSVIVSSVPASASFAPSSNANAPPVKSSVASPANVTIPAAAGVAALVPIFTVAPSETVSPPENVLSAPAPSFAKVAVVPAPEIVVAPAIELIAPSANVTVAPPEIESAPVRSVMTMPPPKEYVPVPETLTFPSAWTSFAAPFAVFPENVASESSPENATPIPA